MTPKRREQIEGLARDAHQKHKRYIALATKRPNSIDDGGYEQWAVDSSLAEADYNEAKKLMREAIKNAGYEDL